MYLMLQCNRISGQRDYWLFRCCNGVGYRQQPCRRNAGTVPTCCFSLCSDFHNKCILFAFSLHRNTGKLLPAAASAFHHRP